MSFPTISQYLDVFRIFPSNIELIFEPGRSLVANTAIIVGKVIGIKNDNCLVTNISMTECIRPGGVDIFFSSLQQYVKHCTAPITTLHPSTVAATTTEATILVLNPSMSSVRFAKVLIF